VVAYHADVPMRDRAESRTEMDSAEESRPEPAVPDAVETTESYETDDGVVLYSAENPLAWLQAEATSAVTLEDAV
jgi:hypothetical protein